MPNLQEMTLSLEQEKKKIRRAILWGAPFLLLLIYFIYFFVFKELITTIQDILNLAPHVRIATGSLLAITVIPMLILILVMLAVKSINPAHATIRWLNKAFNITMFAGIFLLLIGVPIATFLQYRYMPPLGYSPCNILQGNPNKWSNDWVRNPQWCVRGKDRAWVEEQAAKR
ncbi:hypothetical protein M4R22_10300 [Acidovorax sp. GBBC 3334]|uniref:hypothetical protein n=1 Tax=Acidovorax sp. GBBC 3334 TaxID=2940496 RepID=UPI002303C7E4|nr:hypothetical protein [Acidovorax sp. GBBC 3334]MDA8455155.1 hypothetical protein [Acidovorax sp. GBBC 3334]